jgi:hypothetical protein
LVNRPEERIKKKYKKSWLRIILLKLYF